MISADLAESDFTDGTSPEAVCAVVLFVFGLIPRVLRIPSAIPFAIWLKFLSNVSLSLSFVNKAGFYKYGRHFCPFEYNKVRTFGNSKIFKASLFQLRIDIGSHL